MRVSDSLVTVLLWSLLHHRSIVMTVSVCPRVRVYLFRNYTCNLRHFCSCYLWLLLGPPLPCTSGFMDGVVVMFAHDSRRERTYTQSYSPGDSTDLTPRRIFKPTHPARTGRSLLSTIALFVKRTRVQFKMSQVWVFTKSLCCTVGFTRSFPQKSKVNSNGGSGPASRTHGSFGPHQSAVQRHLDQSGRFFTQFTRVPNEDTDTQITYTSDTCL